MARIAPTNSSTTYTPAEEVTTATAEPLALEQGPEPEALGAKSKHDADHPKPPMPHAPLNFGGWQAAMSTGGSVSNAELLAWLDEHGGDLNDRLRGMMNKVEVRNQLTEDLSELKTSFKYATQTEVLSDIADIKEAYAGSGYEDQLEELFAPMIADIAKKNDDHKGIAGDAQERWGEMIQTKTDAFGKSDQMDLLYIQDLTSKAREAVEQISRMMSSINQTTLAVIGNLGR